MTASSTEPPEYPTIPTIAPAKEDTEQSGNARAQQAANELLYRVHSKAAGSGESSQECQSDIWP